MSNLSFKAKITIHSFEKKIMDDFPNKEIEKNIHYENNYDGSKPTNVKLYYVDGKHIGSHCKGEGWLFKKETEMAN